MILSKVYVDIHDSCNESYINILVVNILPDGPLRKYVRQLKMPRVSPFECQERDYLLKGCVLALTSFSCDFGRGRLMVEDEIPDLFTFLLSNGYSIDTKIGKGIALNNQKIVGMVQFLQ